MSHNFKHKSSR